jgi:hypothetical protein
MKKMVHGAAIVAALIAQTTAAETPTPVAIGDGVVHQGTLSGSEVDLYRVRMSSGQVFAFSGGTDDACVLAELANSSGHVLKSACDGIGSFGFDFLSKVDATYTLRLRRNPLNGETEDFRYSFTLDPDCIGDTRSRCGHKLGVWVSRKFSWHSDRDYIRVPVTAGRTYTFMAEMRPDVGIAQLDLRNQKDALIKSSTETVPLLCGKRHVTW